MNKSHIKKWVRELRSGKYSQTTEYLQDEEGFCCLGVACEVFIPKDLHSRNREEYFIGMTPDDQRYAPKWLKQVDDDFNMKAKIRLTTLNDGSSFLLSQPGSANLSFDEIADCLEAVYVLKVLED